MSGDRVLCRFGAGGHGRVVASQWLRRHRGRVVFADGTVELGRVLGDVPVVHRDFATLRDELVLVTIGDNLTRARVQQEALAQNLTLASFVADPENCFTATVGAGSMILAGAVINMGAIVGAGVIVNSNAVVEHDCRVDDFVHLSPGAVVGGGCRIGARVWIGAGATILPQIAIAPDTIVGAGAVVVRDIAIPGTYVGCPAKRLD